MSAVVMKCILLLSAICHSVAQPAGPAAPTTPADPEPPPPGPTRGWAAPKDDFDCGTDAQTVHNEYKKMKTDCIDKGWQPRNDGTDDQMKCCRDMDRVCVKAKYYSSQNCKPVDGLSNMKKSLEGIRNECRVDANVTDADQLCASLTKNDINGADCQPAIGCRISDTLLGGASPGTGGTKNAGPRHTCALSLAIILVVIAFIRI